MFKFGDKIRAKGDLKQKAVVCGVPDDLLTMLDPPHTLAAGHYLLRTLAVPSQEGETDLFELCVRNNIESGCELDEG